MLSHGRRSEPPHLRCHGDRHRNICAFETGRWIKNSTPKINCVKLLNNA